MVKKFFFSTGLSFGCAHHMLPSILNSSFPGRESTANGIALSGACIGAILWPIVMEACINNYGLSGSFLILSAITSHTIPASLLIKNRKKEALQFQRKNIDFDDYDKKTSGFNPEAQTFVDQSNLNLQQTKQNQIGEQNQSSYILRNQNLAMHFLLEDEIREDKIYFINNQYNKDIAFQNNSNVSTDKTLCGRHNRRTFSDKSMFCLENFMIFTDPIYFIMLIVNCGGMTLAVIVWTIILDFVRDKNVGKTLEMYYVVLLPLSDLAGRIFSGIVIDRNFLSKPNMTLVCFSFTALLLVGFVFANNYIVLMFLEFFISVFLGAIFLLQIVLIHEFIEVGKKTMAMTCRFVLYAPISLGFSPMIGKCLLNFFL